MSGITGWIDFERSMAMERPTMVTMTAALACRGTDGEGLWIGRHAALGHRRLAVLDRAGGTQPMIAEPVPAGDDGQPAAVLVYDGVVYNYRELREELASRGHHFRTSGDTEVVLHAFLEWGADCVDHLDGMFAFAAWDPRRETLTLGRDRLGVKPLYYHRTRSGLIFGSEPKAILANPLVEPAVDADGLREIFTFAASPGASAFHGIRKLRAGHVLQLSASGLEERGYWRLQARPHLDDLDTTIATVRDLLEQSVTRQLVSDLPVGVLLSGGLDSSAIAALAARGLAARGERLHTCTVGFARQDENFTPDGIRATSDESFVDSVSGHIGSEHATILVDAAELMDPVARSLTVRAKDLPAPLGDMNVSLYIFCRAAREHAPVTLVGESADSLFGGNVWTLDRELAMADTLPWVAMAQRDGAAFTLGSGLFRPELFKEIDILGFAADTRATVDAEAPVLPDAEPLERRMRQGTYLHLTRFAEYQNTHCDSVSANTGLQARLPFAAYQLWEYVYNVPWAMQTFDGREKSLLRAAVTDLLPDAVVNRRKSPFPITQDPRYDQALRASLARVAEDPRSPVSPLIDTAAVQALLAGAPSRGARAWLARTDIEMVLAMDYWLRAYGLRILL
jgi:asparagine synthase (glutamine-hydrolysing)